jgi:hypothetical protein
MKKVQTPANQIGSDLEVSNSAPLRKNQPSTSNQPVFGDLEWLQKSNPLDYVSKEVSSSKFDEEREKAIQTGLPTVANLALDGVTINPLLILLAKWWEVKPARSAIKKMIDDEAAAKGIDSAVYLQVNLAKEVDKISEMQNAIDRIRYAKTYFKPRKPLTDRIITKPVNIDGIVYIVPVALFEQAKIDFAGDKEALKKEVIGFSKVQTLEVEEL